MQDQNHKTRFEAWLRQYGGMILRVARAYTWTDEDRDDLVQEILLQLWCSLPRFESRASDSTWIYRVALNTALAWRRSDRRRRQRQTPLIEAEEIPSAEADHGARLDNQEVIARLYAAILVCVNRSGDAGFKASDEVVGALIKLHSEQGKAKAGP